MAYVYLLSEKTLKESSAVNNNVDPEYILPSIYSAQEEGLQALIGTKLLRKLQTIVGDGTISTLPDYKSLLDDYVTPYLINKTQAELTVTSTYKIRNSGVTQNLDGEHYAAHTIKDSLFAIQWLKQGFDDKASFFANRMQKFLFHYSNKYPEFLSSEWYALKAKRHAYVTGVYLGKQPLFKEGYHVDRGNNNRWCDDWGDDFGF